MTTTARTYQELSLEQQVQRVRDAWYAKPSLPGDPGWVEFVYPDRIIVEHADGLYSIPYTVGEDDLIAFGQPEKVVQEFVVARYPGESAVPPAADRRGLTATAQDFIRTAARLVGLGDPEPGEQPAAVGMRSETGEGMLLEVPFKVYRDEERYVGGLVLTPGDDNAFGDIWEADDIRVMAYRFMEQSRHIDLMHTTKVVAQPVESYYFPTEGEGGQPEYTVYDESIPAGSWWLGVRVQDDDTWELVKSGDLKGYSMFAVKVGAKKGNRGYAEGSEAPDGQQMKADEWDITMVSLVDQPAVAKATLVVMRRAPDGLPVIARPGDPIHYQTGAAMRQVLRAAYHDDMAHEADKGRAGQETPAAETTGPAAESEATGQTLEQTQEQVAEDAAPGLTDEMADRIAASVKDHLAEIVAEQVKPLIDAAVAPLQQSVATLETRQSRFSGMGALPGGRSAATNPKDEEEKAEGTPPWANFGSRPRKIEASPNGHHS